LSTILFYFCSFSGPKRLAQAMQAAVQAGGMTAQANLPLRGNQASLSSLPHAVLIS
jgi:thiazole synthase ThiGH ThiG subunit